jgi:hypothetical protein
MLLCSERCIQTFGRRRGTWRNQRASAAFDLALIDEVGLERFLEIFEVKDIIDTLGPKKVAKELGVERYLANISAEERRRLKELLK